MVRESDGSRRFMLDAAVVDMRHQAKLMGGGLSGKHGFSEGVFLTIERDGKEHFSSFSPGVHETPKLKKLDVHRRHSYRNHQHWRLTVLPETIMIWHKSSEPQIHVGNTYTNSLSEFVFEHEYVPNGKLYVQPFHPDGQGVYGLDGVFTSITSSNRFKLSSPGVSWVSPPKGKCFVLWWGDYQRPKVCDDGPYYDVSITDISVVEWSSEPEGIISCSNGHANAPIAVTVREVINLKTPCNCDEVTVPEGHEMLVEDDVGRRFWVETGKKTPLTDYAMGSVNRLVLVKGTHHEQPKMYTSYGVGKTFAPGYYHMTDYDKWLAHSQHLWVPPGYTVTVTRKGMRTLWTFFTEEEDLLPIVMTFTQGQHQFRVSGDSLIISIEVSKNPELNTSEHDLLPVLPRDAAIEAAAMRQLGIVSVDHFVASLMNRSGLVS